jgi:hypothetical protein
MGGKRVVQAVALTGLMTLVAGWLAAAPAGAATPTVVHTKVNVSLPDQNVCGFTVDSVVQGTSTVHVFTDRSGNMSEQDTTSVVSTLTNEANGKVVHVAGSGRDRFTLSPVANPDGTFTFTDTLTGIDLRVYTSHSDTLVKDAGFFSIVDTFDSQGNFVSEQVIEHGQHPFAGDQTVFCDAITSAIG